MADVRLTIAAREYIVTCRDGEEKHLESLGALVNDVAVEAGGSAGGLNESRQLLFASLLLADKLHDGNASKKAGAAPKTAAADTSSNDAATTQAAATLEKLADRLEQFADKLEN